MIDPALLQACTPQNVAIVTVREIVRVESGGEPLILHVNGVNLTLKPATPQEAQHRIERAVSLGYNVDIGLMQVNTREAKRLGYSYSQMLDPCTNIRAGSTILVEKYNQALKVMPEGQEALAAALSAYNTGSLRNGFWNGYVSKFYGQAAPKASRKKPSVDLSFEEAARSAINAYHRAGSELDAGGTSE